MVVTFVRFEVAREDGLSSIPVLHRTGDTRQGGERRRGAGSRPNSNSRDWCLERVSQSVEQHMEVQYTELNRSIGGMTTFSGLTERDFPCFLPGSRAHKTM